MSTQTPNSAAPAAPANALLRARRARAISLLLIVAALLLACAASIVIGARDVTWGDIYRAVAGSSDSFAEAAVSKRIPRTALAVIAGAALAVAGLVLQGVTRNPLADTGILGINTGASLAVACGIAWFGLSTSTGYIWSAIAGSTVTAIFVWTVASTGRAGATPLKLTLAGAATAAVLASTVTAVVLPRPDISENVVSWQIGGVGGATDDKLWQMAPFLLAGALVCLWSARGLNLLSLGDDLAAGLGERVARTRLVAALGALTLAGATTAITGPIGFVGLVVPHFCRMLVGVDHRWLLPFSAIAGAILLTVADVVGRVIAPPGEVDVGIITAILGVPFFIWVVRYRKVREL